MSDELNSAEPLLSVQELRVRFGMDGEEVVKGVNLHVDAGEIVALVGESGSGKSVSGMSILGLLPENAQISGAVTIGGADLTRLTPAQRRTRGSRTSAMIFQDPIGSLNPFLTVGYQIAEAVRAHEPSLGRKEAKRRAISLLMQVGMPEPERRFDHYPHQLSGGQCQRVLIAMAISGDPELLIADEPTTALDVTVQADILQLLRSLALTRRLAILLITHDMGVVADLADRVIVMRSGEVVEQAEVHALFARPQAAYTRELLAAVPRIDQPGTPGGSVSTREVLALDELVVEYGSRVRGTRFRAVDGVSLALHHGEFLGLVGESGSGKSTLGRAAIGAVPAASGRIRLCEVELHSASRAERAALRRRSAMVFQNPMSSLDPRYSVGESIAESLIVHTSLRGTALRRRVAELLDAVQLPAGWEKRYPHQLSGGQRQRVSIARALALDPELLVADEPTSALDVSVQARVLELFAELRERLGFACLFISHDLAVVQRLCDRIVVLKEGRVVETGTTPQVLRDPREEYTRALVAASPVPDPVRQRAR